MVKLPFCYRMHKTLCSIPNNKRSSRYNGLYFIYKTEEQIIEISDDTLNVRWINVEELINMVDRSLELFSYKMI